MATLEFGTVDWFVKIASHRDLAFWMLVRICSLDRLALLLSCTCHVLILWRICVSFLWYHQASCCVIMMSGNSLHGSAGTGKRLKSRMFLCCLGLTVDSKVNWSCIRRVTQGCQQL